MALKCAVPFCDVYAWFPDGVLLLSGRARSMDESLRAVFARKRGLDTLDVILNSRN